MLSWLEARFWQILTLALVALSLHLAISLWGANGEIGRLEKKVEQLATCERTSASRKSALETQGAKIAALGEESARRLASAERQIAQAQRENAEARRRLNSFVSQPLTGDTVCERVLELDRRFLEEIVR